MVGYFENNPRIEPNDKNDFEREILGQILAISISQFDDVVKNWWMASNQENMRQERLSYNENDLLRGYFKEDTLLVSWCENGTGGLGDKR